MQTQPLQPGQQPTVVYGLPINDARLAQLTKRVLTMALLSAVLVILGKVVGLILGGHTDMPTLLMTLATAGLALLVPCCGYYGAKNSDQNFTCLFCGCNCLGCTCNIIGIALTFAGVQVIKYAVTQCNPAQPTSSNCDNVDFSKLCPNIPDAQECWQHLDDNMGTLQNAMIIGVIFGVPAIILQCLSFYFGNQLYESLKSGAHITVSPAMPAVQAVAVQPARV